MLSFVKIMQPYKSASHAKQENLYRSKYLLPLKSYGDFHNSVHLASTIKQTLEIKKTTGGDYFFLLSCTIV